MIKIFTCILLFLISVVSIGCRDPLNIVTPLDYKDESRVYSKDGILAETYYVDGMIGQKLFLVIAFVLHPKKNFIEFTAYDLQSQKSKVYHFDYLQNEVVASSSEHCSIRMGNNYIEGKDGSYTIMIKNNSLEARLRFVPAVDNFGIVTRRKGKPQVLTLKNPRMRITEAVIRSGQNIIKGQGEGYYEHIYVSKPGERLMQGGWYWGRFYTKNYTVVVTQFFHRYAYLVLYKNNKVISSFVGSKELISFGSKGLDSQSVPNELDFKWDMFSFKITNRFVTRTAKDYSRWVTDFMLTFDDGKSKTIECGEGVIEHVKGFF